ncbi:MAG: hypothetical protein R3C05_27270 [Pirellulaceae bacterium]
MRTTILAANLLVSIFFACFVAYTFIARQHLDGLARDFVTEKTLEYSTPVVDLAEEAIRSPIVTRLLSSKGVDATRNEIESYRNDPRGFVVDLTRPAEEGDSPSNENRSSDQVASIKNKIRKFYNDTLNALIADLRLFSISNLIAGIIAATLAYRSTSEVRKPMVWYSALIFIAVLYCCGLYIDRLTFFRILFRTHMGWSYPLLLCGLTYGLYMDLRQSKQATEEGGSHGGS